MSRARLLDRVEAEPVLVQLGRQAVNYRADEVDLATWTTDTVRSDLPGEAPGPPEPRGSWETACRLLDAYEISDPALIRAVYRADAPLLSRDMLLEGRFAVLRFYMGVRITAVVDEDRPTVDERRHGAGSRDRVWGWSYETLQGHVERGRMAYEVVKHEGSGEVELVITAYSQGAPSLGPLTRLGWRLFGRRTQLRFYHHCGLRLARAVSARRGQPQPVPDRRMAGGLVLAPSDAEVRFPDAFAVRRNQPG